MLMLKIGRTGRGLLGGGLDQVLGAAEGCVVISPREVSGRSNHGARNLARAYSAFNFLEGGRVVSSSPSEGDLYSPNSHFVNVGASQNKLWSEVRLINILACASTDVAPPNPYNLLLYAVIHPSPRSGAVLPTLLSFSSQSQAQ